MATLIDTSVPVLTFLLLAAVGMDLTWKDFERVRRQPVLVLAGVIVPVLALPPIAMGLTDILDPPAEAAAGLLLVAACPIGGISNTYSYLARASTALSVTLTGLSCLIAGITMPLLGRAIALAFENHPDVQLLSVRHPMSLLAGQLIVLLSVPVALGMLVRRRWTEWTTGHRGALQRFTFLGVAVVLALIILDDPPAFFLSLRNTVPLAALFVLCSAAVGWATASIVSRDPGDRFTLAAEFGTRNLGVAMTVAVTLLGRVEFARFAYAYFLVEMPLMLAAIVWFRRRTARSMAMT